MQEKTDNDDMSKAVKLNFIREMTLFSPVCTLMPLDLAARIWCHLPDLSHTETTKADYSEWNCCVENTSQVPRSKRVGRTNDLYPEFVFQCSLWQKCSLKVEKGDIVNTWTHNKVSWGTWLGNTDCQISEKIRIWVCNTCL